jgi:outer membrane protein OmpA-like peptidoglycan-associated protein
MRTFACVIACAAVAACQSARPLRLRKVVLYQNGIGYFERGGRIAGETLRLRFPKPELDDVLKTLTVIERGGAGVATVAVHTESEAARTVELDVRMASKRARDLFVAYAVPTPTWKAAYRVVLDDDRPPGARDGALLQAWAMVNNVSQEDWNDVELTLATGAPMSFAMDLHTPRMVARPDATGRMVTPTVLGPIEDERAVALDNDADGIPDTTDRCPDSPEDADNFEDDGCPEADNDADRIPDRDDRCPHEPETYNGTEDTDGCPDRGLVIVSSSEIAILEAIYFGRDSDQILASAEPILDAIAATLAGNAEVVRVELGGHAGEDETDPWGLSGRRAAAVRKALIARGVAAARLELVPYGATRLIDRGTTEAARARNRRTDFEIAERADAAPRRTGGVGVRAVEHSVRAPTAPADVAGTVRYELTETVSIPRGVSTMVSIVNRRIPGEDAMLFRPDPNAPGSDRHPFRAVRVENASGFTLQPGPVAVYARGSFVGDGLLRGLDLGETAWIPYAIDSATTVTAESDHVERPVRIISVHRGVATVEDSGVRTTRYTVQVGREPPARLFVHHRRAAGYTAKGLPPDTVDQGDTYLVPVPVSGGKTSVLAVDERQPHRRTVALLDLDGRALALYVEGGGLPAPVEHALRAAIAVRKELGALEGAVDDLRDRLGDVAARADEIRENLRALDGVGAAGDLRKKLVASLTETNSQSDAIARQIGERTAALATARARLADAIREVTLEETVAANTP